MSHQPFVVHIELFTPMILNHDLTLDAVLAAAVSHETGLRSEDVIPHIPLKMSGQIFHGSILWPMHERTPRRQLKVSKIGGLRMGDFSCTMHKPNGLRRYISVNKQSGDYRNVMNTYQAVSVQHVKFYGCGDIERVAFLLRYYVMGLGKHASRGMGEIRHVSVLPIEHDLSLFKASFDGADGLKPMRPLPLELWKTLSHEALPTQWLRVTVPYTASPVVAAVSPVSPWR